MLIPNKYPECTSKYFETAKSIKKFQPLEREEREKANNTYYFSFLLSPNSQEFSLKFFDFGSVSEPFY